MGRALTEALHEVCAEDLAGPLRPEIVTGNVFTVAPTEHQLVAVFFLLRRVKTPCLCSSCVGPLPGLSSLRQPGGRGLPWPHCPLGCIRYRPALVGWDPAEPTPPPTLLPWEWEAPRSLL